MSLRFYVDGLGFQMTEKWEQDGKVRWCSLQRDGVALMLQEWGPEHRPSPDSRPGVADGYRADFESKTDAPEESELEE